MTYIPFLNLEQDEQDRIRLRAFLKDLSKISEKWGMYVQGCGCCGSPWIFDERAHKNHDNLLYTDNGYIVDDMED